MNFIVSIVAIPLGIIMKFIYGLVSNYGVAIFLFTLLVKLLMFPLTYKQQKNAARMRTVNSKLKELQEQYKNNPMEYQKAQLKLYRDENINPSSSFLSSFIPVIVLWGILSVVYNPMTYILGYNEVSIDEIKSSIISIDSEAESIIKKNSSREELILLEKVVQNSTEARVDLGDNTVDEITSFVDNFTFMNAKLIETPKMNPSNNSSLFLFLIPILSGIIQVISSIYSNKLNKKRNPDAPDIFSLNVMMYIMPIFSVWLAFTVPAGVGFYWLCSSLISFIISVSLNIWFNDARVERINETERSRENISKQSFMEKLLEQQQSVVEENNTAESIDFAEREVHNNEKIEAVREVFMNKYCNK